MLKQPSDANLSANKTVNTLQQTYTIYIHGLNQITIGLHEITCVHHEKEVLNILFIDMVLYKATHISFISLSI